MAEAGSSRYNSGMYPCGRRRPSWVQPRPIYTEAELAALIFWIQRHLPSMLAAGGRPGRGYAAQERLLRWGRVRRCVRGSTGVKRTTQQLIHRWNDIIDREQDLLDFLGVEVVGLAPKGKRASEQCEGAAISSAVVTTTSAAADSSVGPTTPAAGARPSRRSYRLEAIAAEYRKLMVLEEEEEEEEEAEEEARASSRSSQPSPPPLVQPYQRQHRRNRRYRRQQPRSTTAATQKNQPPSSSSTTDRLLRCALHELELILLGQKHLAQEVAYLHARLDAL
ncbi:uncharacterized protein LOC144782584 [Lissotriton helveticus]